MLSTCITGSYLKKMMRSWNAVSSHSIAINFRRYLRIMLMLEIMVKTTSLASLFIMWDTEINRFAIVIWIYVSFLQYLFSVNLFSFIFISTETPDHDRKVTEDPSECKLEQLLRTANQDGYYKLLQNRPQTFSKLKAKLL